LRCSLEAIAEERVPADASMTNAFATLLFGHLALRADRRTTIREIHFPYRQFRRAWRLFRCVPDQISSNSDRRT